MKKTVTRIALLHLVLFTFSSCEIIGGIFKAGMGFGIFISVVVMVALIYLAIKLLGRK
ncbi:hypothetical protein SLW70_10885 [Flavobacterium sp. NG2]|uniref:hypothetical protein n=1 Tax=Flavobacterium sp. NG2 TaxID=3097547 RepID=UPI002A817848|nr:hypothetical protein [Flavobacterium sp. NG2]WPR70447.1 hypothetical protein SLW70_10885 [Flavobacterium sp. NG2]